MRTRLGFMVAATLGLASIVAPPHLAAQDVAGTTAAAEATLPDGATFNGVPLSGLGVGYGVSIAEGGSAAGQFHAVLHGTTLLGDPLELTVDGEVSDGLLSDDGSATFSGIASVDMGDGTLALQAVPFTVTASTGSLQLILDATTLPPAEVTAGSITVEERNRAHSGGLADHRSAGPPECAAACTLPVTSPATAPAA